MYLVIFLCPFYTWFVHFFPTSCPLLLIPRFPLNIFFIYIICVSVISRLFSFGFASVQTLPSVFARILSITYVTPLHPTLSRLTFPLLLYSPCFVLFFLSPWDTSLPSVPPMTSSSAAYSQFMPPFRCWLPWIQPLWTGSSERQFRLQTPPPRGARSAARWCPLPLKPRPPRGKSGTSLAQVCFTSFA